MATLEPRQQGRYLIARQNKDKFKAIIKEIKSLVGEEEEINSTNLREVDARNDFRKEILDKLE